MVALLNPWFNEPKGTKDEPNTSLGTALASQIGRLEGSPLESSRRQNLLYDLELYSGQKLSSLYQMNGDGYERIWNPDLLVFNVCYSLVNTIRNRICSFRARAQFLPNGGDYKARRACRERTEMSDAWADEVHYQDEASLAFRDCLTGDGGVYKVWKENGKVKGGRFPAWEFFFDEGESIYGEPECAYHVRYMPVEQAAEYFRLDEQKLRAQTISSPQGILYITNRELVRVAEAWRRLNYDDKGEEVPGRRILMVGTEIVDDEEWMYDGFPLPGVRFDERAVGIWGTGAITPIRSIQIELNEMQRTLREAHRLSASKVIQYQQNEDAPTKFTNAYVSAIPYQNTPAQIETPPAINPEAYQYVDVLKRQAFETLGVSQFIASGTKQPGLNAAVAIREASDMQTDRLALLSQRWEDMRVEAAGWWWTFTKELAKEGKKPKWRAISRGAWKEMTAGNFDQESEIRRFPSSVFGQTVAAKLQKATELVQAQFLTKEDAMKGLDIPDLAPIVDLALSQSYLMESIVDDILEKGDYSQPDPYIDPVAFESYCRSRYFLALSDKSNYPEQNMGLLRRLIDTITARAAQTRAAAQAAAQPPAPVPGVVPPQGALAGAGPDLIQQQQQANVLQGAGVAS